MDHKRLFQSPREPPACLVPFTAYGRLTDTIVYLHRKGQATTDVLFGGASLGDEGVKALGEMKKIGEKGINID